ncbi:MAG: glycosyltransferase [Coprothermobacter sp.]|nr:glycosyltransferase [Coprothermobacter sp.]
MDLKAIPGVYNLQIPDVYVGRIKSSEKRLDRLLKAFEHFSRQHRGWRLTLVGDGEDRAFIQSVVEQLGLDECVDISGWKSDPWRYISDTGGASFLALTSDHEDFGWHCVRQPQMVFQ